jgi:hypothetical protein
MDYSMEPWGFRHPPYVSTRLECCKVTPLQHAMHIAFRLHYSRPAVRPGQLHAKHNGESQPGSSRTHNAAPCSG